MPTNDIHKADAEINGSRVTFTSHHPRREKILLTAVIVFVILSCAFLTALVVVLMLGRKSPTESSYDSGICMSEQCIKTAASILDTINKSADPCEDFFEFSCGNWIRSHMEGYGTERIDEASNENIDNLNKYLTEARQQDDTPKCVKEVAKAVKVCSDFRLSKLSLQHLKTLQNALSNFGGWPIVERVWHGRNYDWMEIYSKAYKYLNSDAPIRFDIEINPEDTYSNVLTVAAPESDIQEPLDIDLVERIVRLLGHIRDNASLWEDLHEIQQCHMLIANNTMDGHVAMEIENEHMMLTIQELERVIPGVGWLNFLNSSFHERIYSDSGGHITKDDKVLLLGKSPVSALVKFILQGNITKRTLANYLGSRFVISMLDMHNQIESNMKNVYKRKPPLRKTSLQDWTRGCISDLMEKVGFVFDYVRGRNRKEKSIDQKMFDYLISAVTEIIFKSTWLDHETKKGALEKIKEMVHFSSYPPWTQDTERLQEYFDSLPEMTDDFLANKINITRFANKKFAQTYLQRNDRTNWPPFPDAGSSVNAFYSPDFNAIVIPAGIQVSPFFSPDRPMYMNFGGIGLVLGHEITHAFDKEGSMRGKYGNLRNWWTEKSKREYEKRAQCFINQYNSYEYGEDTGLKVDGVKTLSENIADNGGVRQAYLAYRNWENDQGKEKTLPGLEEYDSRQLFFMSIGGIWCASIHPPMMIAQMQKLNQHSYARFRVLGALSNMKEFAESFKCKPGTFMNPRNKCVIW